MKIHCSLLDPSNSSEPSFPLYKVSEQDDNCNTIRTTTKTNQCEKQSCEDLVCSIIQSNELEGFALSTTTSEASLSSCQLSPDSEFSMFPPAPGQTPPASDLEDCTTSTVSSHNLPASSSPSYYTLSPPDLLSPPLSTTSTASEPCLSPSSQASPPHHNMTTYNICSQSSNEDSLLTSFGTKDNEASLSIMAGAEAAMQPRGQEQSSSDNSPQPACDQTITLLSSTASSNCSQQIPVCSKQSKLKEFYQLNQPQHQDQQPQNLSLAGGGGGLCGLPAEENFMKLMENCSDKNIKQSMSGERKEKSSTATLTQLTQQRTQSCPLPPDIPTLDSLSKSSPKLSTWRQTRIISEKLEQHLWTWRCACKKSGKRISKSLLQARAKWAFRKAGIVEFKVIIYIELGLTPGYLMKFRGSSYTSGILIGPNITESWYFNLETFTS